MSLNINYRLLNEKGLTELENIKHSETNQLLVLSKSDRKQKLAHFRADLSAHVKSWINSFPALIKNTGELIVNRNEDSLSLVKRQSWNTFIAKPAEIVATLISPVIDEVAYKTFCLKMDYDFYLPEKIEKLTNELTVNNQTLNVNDETIENPNNKLEDLLFVIKNDLKNNPDLKEVKLGERDQALYIPKDIALNLNNLTLEDIIATRSSNKTEALELLAKIKEDDLDKLGDVLYSNNAISWSNLDEFLKIFNLTKELKIEGLSEKLLLQGESLIKEMNAKELIQFTKDVKPFWLSDHAKEHVNKLFSQTFSHLLEHTPDYLSNYIEDLKDSGIQVSELTFNQLAISENQLEMLSKLPGIKQINMRNCEFTGDIRNLREKRAVEFNFT